MARYDEVVDAVFKLVVGHEWEHKRPGRKRSLAEGLRRYGVNRKTGNPTLEVRVIDRERDAYEQLVWEKGKDGRWRVIHEHIVPLSEKDKKRSSGR